MKVQLPDQLKVDVPPTSWGKILAAAPVVMAVVATLLAIAFAIYVYLYV